MTETTQTRVRITGRVQGVFFRKECQDMALELKLTGWVRNLPSGEVEAVFEGPSPMVERMEAWCHKGPLPAKVTSVEAKRSLPPDGFKTFEIRY